MKTFIMIASAVVLFSTAASADTTVNHFKVICDPNVEKGTLKLSNPPTINCKDFELANKFIGSGIVMGPNTRVNALMAYIRKALPRPVPTTKVVKEKINKPNVVKITKKPVEKTKNENSQNTNDNVAWKSGDNPPNTNLKIVRKNDKKALDDFSGNFRGQVGYIDKQFNYHYPTEWPDRLEFNRNFPGLSRNAKWFDEKETTCTGWVSLSDIVSGRCGDARIKVE